MQIEGKVKTSTYKKENVDVKTWVIKANGIIKIDYSQAEEISDANEDA